jgi:hypothetical protein
MSWEYEDKNIILTLENLDKIEEAYSSRLFNGIELNSYYVIKSWNPDYFYGISNSVGIFTALRRIMKRCYFGGTGSNDTEYLNHWRWYPGSSGGTLKHWYTSRDLVDGPESKKEFTRLKEMNQETQDFWNKMNSLTIDPPFYKGGDPLKKLGLGIKITDLWWCSNNTHVYFRKRDKKELILEI